MGRTLILCALSAILFLGDLGIGQAPASDRKKNKIR